MPPNPPSAQSPARPSSPQRRTAARTTKRSSSSWSLSSVTPREAYDAPTSSCHLCARMSRAPASQPATRRTYHCTPQAQGLQHACGKFVYSFRAHTQNTQHHIASITCYSRPQSTHQRGVQKLSLSHRHRRHHHHAHDVWCRGRFSPERRQPPAQTPIQTHRHTHTQTQAIANNIAVIVCMRVQSMYLHMYTNTQYT